MVLAAHIARVLFALGVLGVECVSIPSILGVLEKVILRRLQQRLLKFWLLDLCGTNDYQGSSCGFDRWIANCRLDRQKTRMRPVVKGC
jgi:hypothetical protein